MIENRYTIGKTTIDDDGNEKHEVTRQLNRGEKRAIARNRDEPQYINDDAACSRCGKCCQYLLFPFHCKTTDCNEYFFTHGCEIIDGVGMLVYSPCKHLKMGYTDGKPEATCDIYAKRPKWCHLQSTMKHFKHAGCTCL